MYRTINTSYNEEDINIDVKNKVDENIDENISKKNVQDKDGLTVQKTELDYNLGELSGYLKCRLDGFQYTKKDIIKANIAGLFSGVAAFAVGHLIGQKLGNYLFNKNHN